MPLWLYDLPEELFGLLIILGWIAIGLLGHEALHRFGRPRFDDGDKNAAMALLGVVATVNSLLLAFSAVSVWDDFSTADKAVSSEAATVSELARDLAILGTAESLQARGRLKAYAQQVVTQEWPAMRNEEEIPSVWETFDGIFHAVGEINPATPREVALMPEIWARSNELIRLRQDRLAASKARVPGTLWLVVLIGTLLSIVPAYVLPRTAFSRTAIGLLSLAMGLVFFFVAAMDRPFAGAESIGPEPFELSLQSMARWDAEAENGSRR